MDIFDGIFFVFFLGSIVSIAKHMIFGCASLKTHRYSTKWGTPVNPIGLSSFSDETCFFNW